MNELSEGRLLATRKVKIIELVGPGGTGKTTVSRVLQSVHGVDVIRIPEARNVVGRIRGYAVAFRFSILWGLGLKETLSLARKCSSVESGLRAMECLSEGFFVLDEGPIRTLRDTRCSTYRERTVWWEYAKQVLTQIQWRGVPVLVVNLVVVDCIWRERYRVRQNRATASIDAKLGIRNQLRRYLGLWCSRGQTTMVPTNRRAISAFIAQKGEAVIGEALLHVADGENPESMAERLLAKVGAL